MGLDITGIGSIFDFGSKIVDKIFPNKDDANKAKLALMELQQKGELAELNADLQTRLEQMKVNTEEAKNASMFVSGWRPAAGWVCVTGLFYSIFLRPIMSWISTLASLNAVPPVIDTVILMELLFGMLGLGAYRTYEKTRK